MKKLFFLSLLAVFLMTGSAVIAQSKSLLPDDPASKIQGNYFVYDGYRFDISQVLNDEHLKDVLLQLEWQVHFIEVLNLPQEIQDFFKAVPTIVASPEKEVDLVNYGDCDDYNITTSKAITLRLDNLLSTQYDWRTYHYDYPLFLIMLLMAFFDQHLPQGVNNPDILKYFQEAKSLPCYQIEKPFWISDTSSDAIYYFFSNSAMAYLRGSFWNAPFSCYEIQKNQPEFFHYLETLFGPKSGFIHQSFSYHGFNFNWSRMDDFSHYQEVCNECVRQVSYIESIGLPKNITDFFKSVPITLKSSSQMHHFASGTYYPETKSILLCHDYFYEQQENGKKTPTLLHELIHAFHDQCISNSVNNSDIIKFFQDAQQYHYYQLPHTWYPSFINYLMTNEVEFFACTASVFLVDFEEFQPFNRDNIFQHQPDYYRYLIKIFGMNPYDLPVEKMNSLNIDVLY